MAVYALTDKCNLNCLFCSNEDFKVYYAPPDYLPHTLEEMKEYFRKHIPPKEDNITLTGGEPTLRNDLSDIFDYITHTYPQATIILLTNGRRFFYEEYCIQFRKYKKLEIEIALNSHIEKVHDGLTMCKGSFRQTNAGIKNLLKNGIKTNVRIIITKKNCGSLSEFSEFIKINYPGINKVVFIFPRIKGRAKENIKSLIPRFSSVKKILNKSPGILTQQNIPVQFLHIPFCILDKEYWKNTLKNPYKKDMPQCTNCSQRDSCPGVSESYVEYFGNDEFKTFNK